MPGLALFALLAALSAVATACELREVTVAQPADVLVAEVLLRAGDSVQTALLHRTVRQPGVGYAVPGAVVEVRHVAGATMRYTEAPLDRCIFVDPDSASIPRPGLGSCYVAGDGVALPVREGETYTLAVTAMDGRVLTGTTRVPGDFRLRTPVVPRCTVAPGATLTLVWSPSADAWAYLAEASFQGLRSALAPRGVAVPADPLTLLGLAITASDTTMALPGGFGVFDRFDPELAPTLLALQGGIPGGVAVDVVIAAVDRNVVNWVRGGNFNPSGQVRVPSVRGAGTGVFGSVVPRRARVEAIAGLPLPACGGSDGP